MLSTNPLIPYSIPIHKVSHDPIYDPIRKSHESYKFIPITQGNPFSLRQEFFNSIPITQGNPFSLRQEFYKFIPIHKGNPFSLKQEFYSDYYPFSKNGNEYKLAFDMYGLDPYIEQKDDELVIYHKNPHQNLYRIKLDPNMMKETLQATLNDGVLSIQCQGN